MCEPYKDPNLAAWKHSKNWSFYKMMIKGRGSVGEKLCQYHITNNGIDCGINTNDKDGYDLILTINGKNYYMETKTIAINTTKANGGTFNQLRLKDDRYDYFIFVLVYPDKELYYFTTKENFLYSWNNGYINCSEQHPPKNGEPATHFTCSLTKDTWTFLNTLSNDGSVESLMESINRELF